MALARRAHLHAAVGQAIETKAGTDAGPMLSVLAHHFCEAARGGPAAKAIEYSLLAGERAAAGVVAAGTAEPERAGSAPGGDVGRLGAHAEGNRDLAQGPPGVLGVEQGLRRPPDAVAVRSKARAVTRSTACRRRGSPTR
ncbi:MAG: hypothetical protein ACRD1K_19695 [Acidimicrobiales bacterium]